MRTGIDEGYSTMAEEMERLVEQQDGYLGNESFRNEEGFGVTISYWRDLDAVKAWKANNEHLSAQKNGRNKWYSEYKIRICRIERDYDFKV
jgi:heme-degrading monooxygenase HmoA